MRSRSSAQGRIVVAPGGHFLEHEDGSPFFWLADTGWLLFSRLRGEEAALYLDDRRDRGFGVVQAMLVPGLPVRNPYGAEPFEGGDPGRPDRGGYWDHVDDVVDMAATRGIRLALVPVWGSVVRRGQIDAPSAAAYGAWLGRRFRDRHNIFWLNGGDVRGDRQAAVWHALGRAIKEADPHHLMTFHPFGRTQSSQWFWGADWLDFHMCQSGHRRYDQADPGDEHAFGEDNWRYIRADWDLRPARPTLDGEPSYEGIPQGLHDPREPLWKAADARRYAYWAVFAGACGHTYGNGAVMQMAGAGGAPAGYGVRRRWTDALADPGAGQMRHLRDLVLSRPFEDRAPDDATVAGDPGERYDRLLSTRGTDYAFVYTHTGRSIAARLGVISGDRVRAWWYDPRTGRPAEIGEFENRGVRTFTPPTAPAGAVATSVHDWVLVLDDASRGRGAPGALPA